MTIHAVPRTDDTPAQPRENHVFDVVARVRELAERKQRLKDELAAVNSRLDAIVRAATGDASEEQEQHGAERDTQPPEPKPGRPPFEAASRLKTVVPAKSNVGGAPRMNAWISKREGTFKAADLSKGADVTDQYARTHICWLITQNKVTKIEPGLYMRSEGWT